MDRGSSHLAWHAANSAMGDPLFAAAYSRAFQFCGSNGAEIMEPLSFKGRRGSGQAGSRCRYADAVFNPRWDWQKFEYSTRIWGRMLYNPEIKPEVWRRWMHRQFGPGAMAMETALSNVSRILPVIIAVHAPSVGNNMYWPEMYFNQSMVDKENYGPYGDSQAPHVFGNASAMDPELFLSINEYAEELLEGKFSAKYSPVEVAQWIEDFAVAGRAALAQAEGIVTGRSAATYRRMKVDIEIQVGLGEFFVAKFRSGVLFHLYEVTKERLALEASIAEYRKARAAWAELANAANGIYLTDITVGEQPYLRGHWMDRLAAIDRDIAALTAMLNTAAGESSQKVEAEMRAVLGRPRRAAIAVRHVAPARFKRGEELSLTLSAPADLPGVRLHYRRIDQAENYVTVEMERQNSEYAASIPAAYTQTVFPLAYFFSVNNRDGKLSCIQASLRN